MQCPLHVYVWLCGYAHITKEKEMAAPEEASELSHSGVLTEQTDQISAHKI